MPCGVGSNTEGKLTHFYCAEQECCVSDVNSTTGQRCEQSDGDDICQAAANPLFLQKMLRECNIAISSVELLPGELTQDGVDAGLINTPQ